MSDDISNYFVRKKLTNKMISKYILSPISFQIEPPSDLVNALGINSIIGELSDVYKKYKKVEDDNDPEIPRYMPFYRFIKEKVPGFEWEITNGLTQPISILTKPKFAHGTPSLLNLLTAAITDELIIFPELKIKYPSLKVLPNKLVFDIENILIECGFSCPENYYWESISEALLRGLNGEKITLISPVCPDYSYEKFNGQYRYTFNSVRDGIGLVARRIVNTLPKIRDILVANGIDVEIVVAAGDFESLDSTTLTRLGETPESFLRKLKTSQDKVIKSISTDCKSMFFINSKNDLECWNKSVALGKRKLFNGDIGFINNAESDFNTLLNRRLPLYKAWNPQKNNKEFMDMLLAQGAEYASMGREFNRRFKNPLIIGADHLAMMPFYCLFNKIPVIYLKRVY